ncbi:MAG: class I mannose-6-phosphate isomerase [Treponemataceae bacterium]|nr:class I mannose-6-phosphate isomerase [Treponemataceae bacterium]
MMQPAPIELKKIWGCERWLASTHPNGTQPDFAAALGGGYPLLVKIIQADDRLSVQVHPDDRAAAQLEGAECRGKTECWYVLDAEPGARLISGFSHACSAGELEAAVRNGTVAALLEEVPVARGDFVFIPAGTVHAIGAGMRLLEVQQSCDTTYRLYDWGRGRELHIEKALRVARRERSPGAAPFPGSFSCEYFSLERLDVRGGWSMRASGERAPESWQLLFVLEGSGAITDCATGGRLALAPEQLHAVAPGDKITVEGTLSLLRIRCGRHDG